MNALWSKATGASIGIDWLANAIAPSSAYGRRARESERPFRCGDEAAARAALGRVAAVAGACTAGALGAIASAIAGAPEILTALERTRAGGTLADSDFFELGRFFDALDDVVARLPQTPVFEAFAPLRGGERVRAAIAPGRGPGRSFYIVDAFDAALGEERERAARAQADLDAARTRAHEEVAAALGLPAIRDGEFTISRKRLLGIDENDDGRGGAEPQPLELPANVRIVREGASYLLCRLEPDDDELFALDERDETANAVAETEEDVRARLSAVVERCADELDAARGALGELDALVARAAFVLKYSCVVPEICDVPEAALIDLRYVPLDEELQQSGRRYAPISFDLAGVAVVTGPNMGGKTAALRALGFAVACAALGVPVPARFARVPLVDSIAWLGLEEAVPSGVLLSSFGREVVSLRDVLATPVTRGLVLVDEFARTTSPREGRALTVALVRAFAERRALGLVATHFTDVAADADAPHFTSGWLGTLPPQDARRSLDAALARIASAMEYGLLRVSAHDAPSADALALAEALGLDAETIAIARDAL